MAVPLSDLLGEQFKTGKLGVKHCDFTQNWEALPIIDEWEADSFF